MQELLERTLEAEIERGVFIGESLNDQIRFEHLPHSVGLANVACFLPQVAHLLRHVRQQARGAGCAELAQLILDIKIC